MDIDQLHAFSAVARLRSFSEAANRLYLTQPAISKRIDRLEDELAYKLFDRMGRQVMLTEAGRTLLPLAEKILEDVAGAKQAINNLGNETSGELKLVTSHHIGLHRLPPLLKSFTQQYPLVHLCPEFHASETALEQLEQGEFEIGVITLPQQLPRALHYQALWDDKLVYVCAKDHPLAALSHTSQLELLNYPAILPARGSYTRNIIDHNFGELSQGIDDALSTNFLQTNKMMTSIGIGWSVLPEIMVDEPLTILDVSQQCMIRSLGVIYHQNRSLSRAANAFLQLLRAEVPNSNHN